MGKYIEVFVAFDVAKKKHAVAIAEGGRTGEVRFLGDVENSPLPIERTIKRLAGRYDRLHICFEAGPTGYGLYRQIQALGHECMVVAPALIPKRSGERIKTNRRDAVTLARLHRAGELTGVWTPDAAHEAVRDLVRAREAATDDLRRKRQQLLSFLLRHSRIYSGGGHWTMAHRRWLANQKFEHAAQQIVFQEGIDAIEDAVQRLRRLEKQLALIVPEWSMAPVVEAYQAMRGASFLVAVTFAAEIGDVRRFHTPRQLMSFLGLVPAERSTGDTIRRNGLTLAGNRRARRALIEGHTAIPRESARPCEPGWKRCQSPSATLPGKHRSVCAPATVGSAPQVRSCPSSWRRSLARWLLSYGPSAGRSLQRKPGRPVLLSAAQSREWSTKGGELPSLVMWPGCRPTPVL
jgi:transposase